MFAKAGVAHIRIIYFLLSDCSHVDSCKSDCMPDNGINCFTSGPVLQYFTALDSFGATMERVQVVDYSTMLCGFI